jgi:steroid 5-alpha reductase family enzyme
LNVLAVVVAGPGGVLPLTCAAVALVILGTWALSLRLRDASVIDPVWGPAFAIVAIIAAVDGSGDPGRRWLLLALMLVWGLRLGFHLTRRKLHEREEDRRYRAMREAHPQSFAIWSLGWVYLLQGVLVVVISLPLQVAAQRGSALSWAIVPGLGLYLVGLCFEAVGDEQLRRFKADPDNSGAVMDHGLWRYTRHPNYFGDACIWWGLWLVALQAGGTWWTVIAPIVMSVLLIRISGKGLLEKQIGNRRPGYASYIERTSGFLPLPPRQSSR